MRPMTSNDPPIGLLKTWVGADSASQNAGAPSAPPRPGQGPAAPARTPPGARRPAGPGARGARPPRAPPARAGGRRGSSRRPPCRSCLSGGPVRTKRLLICRCIPCRAQCASPDRGKPRRRRAAAERQGRQGSDRGCSPQRWHNGRALSPLLPTCGPTRALLAMPQQGRNSTTGRPRLAACCRLPTTGRPSLSAYYWAPATGRLLLGACYPPLATSLLPTDRLLAVAFLVLADHY